MFQTNPEIQNPLSISFFSSPPETVLCDWKKNRLNRNVLVSDTRYTIKLAENLLELTELLKLRYRVFKVETGNQTVNFTGIETDEFDTTSHHLIAVENESGRIIGGYRLRTAETNSPEMGFYSAGEFNLTNLPGDLLNRSVEIGRACIEAEYRHGKVLFLLWKGLARYLLQSEKRFLFGCCSLFSNDLNDGFKAYKQLECGGFLHEKLRVAALKSDFGETETSRFDKANETVGLPKLFTTYLRIGAKVCSQPIIDKEFGTIDFFVIFDSLKMNEKYRKLFFE